MALAALLLVLLTVLAWFQYRWLGRASEADLQRTSASLHAAAARFGGEFNRELADLVVEVLPALMHGPKSADILAGVDLWQSRATWPQLVHSVWQLTDGPDGVVTAPVAPPDGPARAAPPAVEELAGLLARWRAVPDEEPPQGPFFDHPRVLMAEVPAILLPHPGVFRHGRHGERRRESSRWQRRRAEAARGEAAPSVWVVLLDLDVIRNQILPELAQRHFSTETELTLRVRDAAGGLLWSSSEGVAEGVVTTPVAAAELFGPLRSPGDRRFGARRAMRGLFAPSHDVLAAAAGIDHGQWRLEVIHPAGSLDAAVRAARHRGLALSLIILLVLAGSVLLLAHGARRAQSLARRQLEFVAGVTHELRTPLAALRSAGQNLADGVVKPDRVQTYGRLVDREGRRLEEAVGQILAFAGLSTGATGAGMLRIESLDPLDAVRRAVAELAPLLGERRVEVEISHQDDLPSVRADAESLGRALRNLVQNAALHGRTPTRDAEETSWVGVHVEASPGQVRFHVRDRGPGIDPADRKRIFEPFVRGQGLAASNVPGSGLGLALVRQVAEALGGSIRLESGDEFTTFTLTLPAG